MIQSYKHGALESSSAGLKAKERRSQSSKLLNGKRSGSKYCKCHQKWLDKLIRQETQERFVEKSIPLNP